MQWEPKPSRMMLLKMTDGQTEVQGMEYRPIAALTGDLQPGFKVMFYFNSSPPLFSPTPPNPNKALLHPPPSPPPSQKKKKI